MRKRITGMLAFLLVFIACASKAEEVASGENPSLLPVTTQEAVTEKVTEAERLTTIPPFIPDTEPTVIPDPGSPNKENGDGCQLGNCNPKGDCPCVKGQKGSRGHYGLTGDPGPDGPLGVKGKPGLPGHKGYKGEAGNQGERGPDGDEGMIGVSGYTGRHGIPGVQGSRGPKGYPGFPGCKGEEGGDGTLIGSTGLPGLPGPNGDRGPKGQKVENTNGVYKSKYSNFCVLPKLLNVDF